MKLPWGEKWSSLGGPVYVDHILSTEGSLKQGGMWQSSLLGGDPEQGSHAAWIERSLTLVSAMTYTKQDRILCLYRKQCMLLLMMIYRSYSRKLSREKTFANWWKIWFSQRKLSRIATESRNSRKFSPSKVSRYMVVYTLSFSRLSALVRTIWLNSLRYLWKEMSFSSCESISINACVNLSWPWHRM